MKRGSFLLFLVFALFKGIPAEAGQDSSVEVLMSIQVLQVQLVGGNLSISVDVGEDNVLDRAVLRNTGNGLQDYAVKIGAVSGASWTRVNITPGPGEYRLSALWHFWNIKPDKTEFQTNDVVTPGDKISSDTIFFNDAETHSTVDAKGHAVIPGVDSSLFIWAQGPPSGPSESLVADITVTALATP